MKSRFNKQFFLSILKYLQNNFTEIKRRVPDQFKTQGPKLPYLQGLSG